jgi:hypothetical protein
LAFVCSYKEKALRFFKGFKTAVEESNPKYVFKNDPQSLVGKFIGVVLGEEEYIDKKGAIRTWCYVAEKRSGRAIREGDYSIPPLVKLDPSKAGGNKAPDADYPVLEDDDADLPF